jgi:hypothetical protein
MYEASASASTVLSSPPDTATSTVCPHRSRRAAARSTSRNTSRTRIAPSHA